MLGKSAGRGMDQPLIFQRPKRVRQGDFRNEACFCRRSALRLLTGTASLALLTSCGPRLPSVGSTAKRPRVAFWSPSADASSALVGAFLQGLAGLGYRDGTSISIEWR